MEKNEEEKSIKPINDINARDEIKARELTNFDIYYISKKIEKLIEKKARFDQVYDLGDMHFVFRIKTEDEKMNLVFYPPKYIFLKKSESMEIEPTPFAMSIKNMFSNKLIRSVKQINNDRIIEIVFDSGSIILECMKKGNVIILENGKIMNLKERVVEKERELQIGNEYKPPKNERKEITKENIISLLKENKKSEEKLVVLISRNLMFPAVYFNKIMQKINFDPKTKCKDLKEKDIETIAERMVEFYSNLINERVELKIEDEYFLSDEINGKNDKIEKKENKIETNELFYLLEKLYQTDVMSKKSEAKEKRMMQLLNRLKHQEERIKNLEEEIKKEREKGEWIIKNSDFINEIIKRYKELRMKGNKKELEEFLKENGIEMSKNGLKLKIDEN